jgi:phage terminase large subunit-like protein
MAAKNYPEISEQYIAAVLDGSQLVCKTIRQAIDRHVRDLERSSTEPDYPFYFDPAAGAKVCKLLAILKPSKLPKPVELQPWQVCMILLLYGWKRNEDNTRRFRIGFIMLPRKTGKSFLLSGFLINALIADDELGAEAYSAGLVEEQARRVFDEAVAMVEKTPEIRGEIVRVGDQPCRKLRVPSTDSISRHSHEIKILSKALTRPLPAQTRCTYGRDAAYGMTSVMEWRHAHTALARHHHSTERRRLHVHMQHAA